MYKKINAFIMSLLFFAFSLKGINLTAQTPPTEINSMESPYFIDGLHCEGVNAELGWLFDGDEKKRADQQLSQAYCDGFFNMYGIKKFEWYTPEQIEYFQNAIRKSSSFEVKDLALKKSSQQGHVHIFVILEFKKK